MAEREEQLMEQDEGGDLLVGFSSDKPILIDGGLKSFEREKVSGKICLMLGARDLYIVWGSDPRYWRWESSSDSRFPEVASLVKVCWLKITGNVETRMLSPKTTYAAYFVIKMAEQNEGFCGVPVRSLMWFARGSGECSGERSVLLQMQKRQKWWQRWQKQQEGYFLRKRGDGWMEIEMGEFYNDGKDGEVEMLVSEIIGRHWKSGLIVQGMELRPKVST